MVVDAVVCVARTAWLTAAGTAYHDSACALEGSALSAEIKADARSDERSRTGPEFLSEHRVVARRDGHQRRGVLD